MLQFFPYQGRPYQRNNLFSLCNDNLHPQIDVIFLRNYFIKDGNVRDIYIPRNQRTNCKGRYGFVRFDSAEEAWAVANRCNGDYVWGYTLVVKEAIQSRQNQKTRFSNHHLQQQLEEGEFKKATKAAIADRRSNQEVWSKETHGRGSLINNSYGLIYKSKTTDLKWLGGCAVGYLSGPIDINHLQDQMRNQNIHCSVMHMGGNMAMLAFLSEELMLTAINEYGSWLEDYFEYIKPWEENDISKTRFVWLRVSNVPIHAWNSDFFRLVGDQYGTFQCTDTDTDMKKRLDHGRMLVYTPNLSIINRKHRIKIDEKIFEIQVTEDQEQTFNPAIDMKLFKKADRKRINIVGEGHRRGMHSISAGSQTQAHKVQNSNFEFSAKKMDEFPEGDGIGIPAEANSGQEKPNSVPQAHLKNSVDLANGNMIQPNESTRLNSKEPSIESIQFVPESPLDSACVAKETHISKPPEMVVAEKTITPPEIEREEIGEESDEISWAEDDTIDPQSIRRKKKKEKRVERRKSLKSIVNSGGGKLLLQELIKQKKGKRGKSKGGRGKPKTAEKELIATPDLVSSGSIPEDNIKKAEKELNATPELISSGSIPDDNIKNMNDIIIKRSLRAWSIGKTLGMTTDKSDEAVLATFAGIETRSREESDRQQHE